MSDLQCPARVFLARDDLPSARVDSVTAVERIAARYAVSSADSVDPGWFDDIVDRHRGEAVVIVAPAAVISGWLREVGRTVQPHDVLAFEVDSDGWRACAVVTGPIPIQRHSASWDSSREP